MPFDAEVVAFSLPKDRSIQVKSTEDLVGIAKKLNKPILHGAFGGHDHPSGSSLDRKGFHILVVYDGPWVYYCEIQESSWAREGAKPQ